ncbi:CBS domain-containing protein [Melittangium boletus]|uniref:CBS domain-containing protein n=1 Tax=Melittangium boletus DSM 14713 TaxID=1294270 RepID=A0A250I9E4_9BACT|nr:CBS domain-containing protein [Melittangium boletus]ATB27586.1 hypothetical protein MEBOL_001030 [Melittangium boletus DSM 14713]
MDGREQEQQEVAQAVMLFAKDTIMAALRVMQEHGVRQLPVVDEERGEWLGEVTEEELRRLWKVAPLISMAEVLSGTPQPKPTGPEVREVAPLLNFYRVPPSHWRH